MTEKKLSTDKFFLLVSDSGHYLKTRYERDFYDVRSWGDISFSAQVKNSQTFYFKVGQKILKKKISSLIISKPQNETWFFDISELDLHGGLHINKIWLGSGKAVSPEPL